MNPLWLLSLKKYLPFILAGLAIAGAVWWMASALERADQRGYDRRDAIAQTDAARVQEQITNERLANTLDAKVREDALIVVLAEQEERTDAAQIALSGYLAKQASKRYTPSLQAPKDGSAPNPGTPDEAYAPPLLGQSVLDVFTVGVLNDARANRPSSPDGSAAGLSDAEEQAAAAAPTQITGGDFADNDLQIVGLYHDLAARHDQLVDWVGAQCLAPAASSTK